MTGRKPKVNRSTSTTFQDGQVVFRSELGERIRSVLDEFGTRAEAAAVAGVTPEHLASYISGRAKPPFELMARLAAARNISLDWLAKGTGPRSTADDDADGYVAIALRIEAEARYGTEEEPAAEILFWRPWLRARTTAPVENLCLVVHRGNSNEPVIRDGDLLLVDSSEQQIGEDGLYVFPRDGKYLARFAEKLVDGRIALKARNSDNMQPLTEDEAAKLPLLGRVLWRGGLP